MEFLDKKPIDLIIKNKFIDIVEENIAETPRNLGINDSFKTKNMIVKFNMK